MARKSTVRYTVLSIITPKKQDARMQHLLEFRHPAHGAQERSDPLGDRGPAAGETSRGHRQGSRHGTHLTRTREGGGSTSREKKARQR